MLKHKRHRQHLNSLRRPHQRVQRPSKAVFLLPLLVEEEYVSPVILGTLSIPTLVESFTDIAVFQSSGGGQFAGLQGYKRNSQDESRTSFNEQQQQSGVLGQMWSNFTKGK